MSFAYLPLYTGDYLRDTQHLSCSEHGIYLKLLMHCWDQKGPAPLDERKQAGIVNARSSDEIEALRRVLSEFFVRMEDGWYNGRMQKEVERSEAISGARSKAGRKGYQAKAKHLLNTCQSSATIPTPIPILTPTPTPTPTPKEGVPVVSSLPKETGITRNNEEKTTGRRASRLPQDWAMSKEQIKFAEDARPDLDPKALEAEFRDYWIAQPGTKGLKLDWSATWRNWVRRAGAQNKQRTTVPPASDHAGLDALGRRLGVRASSSDTYFTFREKLIEAMK